MLDSSIWYESAPTRIVWLTLLMLKDQNGIISKRPMFALADRAKVTPAECQAAMDTFMAPDPNSTTATDGGRRVRLVPEGWQLINHEQYRFSTEAKRLFWANQKAEQRKREEAEKKLAEQGTKPPKRIRSSSKNADRELSGYESAQRQLENGEITKDQFDAKAAESREKPQITDSSEQPPEDSEFLPES